jgi:hypothetical protein
LPTLSRSTSCITNPSQLLQGCQTNFSFQLPSAPIACDAAVIVRRARCQRKATMVAILTATIGSPKPRAQTQIKPKRTARAVACGAVLTLNFL